MALVQLRIVIPAAATLCYGFLTIRLDDTTILDFMKYAVRYFISPNNIFVEGRMSCQEALLHPIRAKKQRVILSGVPWKQTEVYKPDKTKKRKKGRSVQELFGIKTFTKYGLAAGKYEPLVLSRLPTNISVLSHTNIEIKIRHLMMVLSAIPDIEITCTDSSECFDDNKSYLSGRLSEEQNPKVRKIIKKDIDFLDHIQMEMATQGSFCLSQG